MPFADRKAPLTPATLTVETTGSGSVVLPRPAVLSKVAFGVAAPKLMPVIRLPPASKRLTASPPVLSPMPGAAVGPDRQTGGYMPPNHAAAKALRSTGTDASMKTTDCPGAMLVTPLRGTADAKAFELSSTFQPVMFTALKPALVISNQSAL